MSPDDVESYLARIGADRSASLAEIQQRHLETIPFENLSIHLGEPIDLDPAALFDKLVRRRRGGFCFEQNGLLGEVLEALGMGVDRVGARVFGAGGSFGPPLDHLALVVQPAGDPIRYLADVGFGRFTTRPLRWDERGDQDDPGGRFRLVDTPEGFVDVISGDGPQLRVDPRPVRLTDAAPTCWWHQTSPVSSFTRSTVCSRLSGDGRITLSGRTLVRTNAGGRLETDLPDDDAVLAAYREHFGIVLDRVPVVKFPPPPVPAPAPAP